MDSFISFIKVTVMSMFSLCPDENVETLSTLQKAKVVNYISDSEEHDKFNMFVSTGNNNSKIIDVALTHNLNNIEIDTKIRILYAKLKKNLETLTFISELDFKLERKPKLSEMVKECKAIEKEVRIETIEITRQLSYYKSLKQSACA